MTINPYLQIDDGLGRIQDLLHALSMLGQGGSEQCLSGADVAELLEPVQDRVYELREQAGKLGGLTRSATCANL